MQKKYLSEPEAAEFLGVSAITLYKRRHNPRAKNRIDYFREGRSIYYDVDDLVAHREKFRVKGKTEAAEVAADE